MTSVPARAPWATTSRGLYLVAMAVFLVTLAIGILNGIDAVEFSRDFLLTHVHSGTLGWITLGVAAAACWVFGGMDRRLAIGLATITPIYVLSFATGNYPLRAATGVIMLGVVLALIAWTWRSYLASDRRLAGLALALGLTTFAYGAVIGVLLQLQFALGTSWLSGDAIGAHAAAMVFSYLVLTATGLVEWRLKATRGLPRSGVAQLVALFLGGLVLSVGLLAGAGQAAGGLYLLLNLVAVVLFIARVIPAAIRAPWLRGGPAAFAGASAVWVVVALAIFMYLVVQFVTSNGDTSKISTNILIASDHATFIGVMTNLSFALIAFLAAGRAGSPAGWAGAVERLVFWFINLGLAVFVVGLVANSAEVKRIGAPVMGVAILVGVALFAWRLWQGRAAGNPADEPA
jgi:hypothetical protein